MGPRENKILENITVKNKGVTLEEKKGRNVEAHAANKYSYVYAMCQLVNVERMLKLE